MLIGCNREHGGWRIALVIGFRIPRIKAAFFLALVFAAGGPATAAEPSVVTSQIRLPGTEGAIRAELFERSGRAKRPVILVLHGAGGTLFDGPEMRRVSRHLAASGNAVYLLHYFGRTGTILATDASMQKNFRIWLETVRDSIPLIQEARHDASPVGIYGYSLGGFLALFTASDNPRVGAVVEHAGGVWNEKMEKIGRMPPVLMVHGLRDGRVPFAKYAQPLVPLLRARARKVETRFFAGEAHVFNPEAMKKVRAEAATFFRVHLAE